MKLDKSETEVSLVAGQEAFSELRIFRVFLVLRGTFEKPQRAVSN